MKRLICLFLCFCLVLSLTGCSFFSSAIQNPVRFYYQRAEFVYGQEDGVIAFEERDGTGHIKDFAYLLRLYLMGPHEEELVSPFPPGLLVTDIRQGNGVVILTLTDVLSSVSEAKQTLACACLALTSMDITGQDSAILIWADEMITLDRASLTLYDSSAPQSE